MNISKQAAIRKTLAGEIEAITLRDNTPNRFANNTSYKSIADAIKFDYVLAVCVYSPKQSLWYQITTEQETR